MSDFDAYIDSLAQRLGLSVTEDDLALAASLKECHHRLEAFAVEQEAARLRAQIKQQEKNLAAYQRRCAGDLARAEETALRPHILALLPILDARNLAHTDAAGPDCDPARLAEATGMIAEGLAVNLDRVIDALRNK